MSASSKSTPATYQPAVIGLNAIIIAVTDEVPRILTVQRAAHSLATPAQKGESEAWADSPVALPFGPFDPDHHRTLELGLHNWVAQQTGLNLGYVEQLYTFGDRYRDPREQAGGPRLVVELLGPQAGQGDVVEDDGEVGLAALGDFRRDLQGAASGDRYRWEKPEIDGVGMAAGWHATCQNHRGKSFLRSCGKSKWRASPRLLAQSCFLC